MTLRERLEAGFAKVFGRPPELIVRAPGRINLIGEHTDYNDGFALPMAISRQSMVAFAAKRAPGLSVCALDFGETDRIDLGDVGYLAGGGWRDYVRGVVAELQNSGLKLPAGDLAIAGDLALGTGLSSSASLEIAIGHALSLAVDAPLDPVALALLGQRAESEFVGVRCGVLDQIAVAAATRGNAMLVDCRSLTVRQVPLPDDVVVMIVQSGVIRGLLDGEYNARRCECERAAQILGVTALRDADAEMLENARAGLDQQSYRRARHVIGENARTLEAAEALEADDLRTVGRLMRESQRSQAEDFEIVVPATQHLASILNEAIGTEGGARQTGGGFGGAVIGLMRRDRVEHVRAAVVGSYRGTDGQLPEILVETPCPGVSRLPRQSSRDAR